MSSNYDEYHLRDSHMLPTQWDFLGDKLASLIATQSDLQSTFDTTWEPNDNQKKLADLIEHSQAPEGSTLHILLHGETGTGKSMAVIRHAVNQMIQHPSMQVLGIRRTVEEIKASTFKDTKKFLDMWKIPIKSKKESSPFEIEVYNGAKFIFTSDKTLVGEKEDKASGLGSTAYSMVIVEEADSVSETLADTLIYRMRENSGVGRKIIFWLCNPPDTEHWLWLRFFGDAEHPRNPNDPASRWRAIHFRKEANIKHLGDRYFKDIAEDAEFNPALAARLAGGMAGPAVKGDPVFQRNFSLARHVRNPEDSRFSWNPALPMLRGWDFGFHGNCCIIAQDDVERGQIRVFKEMFKKNVLFDPFSDQVLEECYNRWPQAKWKDFGDSAGRQQTALTADTYHSILRSKGCQIVSKPNTPVEYGLNIIADLLGRFFNNKSCIYIDIEGAPKLIQSFLYGYVNKKETTKQFDPVKDGVYDHYMDAFRYLVQAIRKIGHNKQFTKVDPTHGGLWTDVTDSPRLVTPAYASHYVRPGMVRINQNNGFYRGGFGS